VSQQQSSAKRVLTPNENSCLWRPFFAVIFGGGLLGFLLSRRLPESYNDAGTRAVVTTAMRTVSLLSALVLGLLVATAKNKFDSNNAQTERFAADVMSLNREL
jgi:hypothetical protein